MFQNRVLNILCTVILLALFSAGQVFAASGNLAGSNSASLAGQEELVQKVKETYLDSKPGIDTALVFTSDISQEDPWVFGIVGNQASAIQEGPSLVYFIAKNQENGWKVALEQTDLFAIWLDIAPISLINDDIKGILKIRSIHNPITPDGLGLPWDTGQSWTLIKGPNSTLGETRSSMDFQGPDMAGQVRSAKDGLVTISSSCPNFVLVTHNGFKTGYYHLINIAVENNQMIERGAVLGDISTQAGCGGFATEPLVSFSIKNSDGTPVAMDGFDIGGWNIIQDTETNKNCLNRANDELKTCQGESLFNDGTIENETGNSALELTTFSKTSPVDGATNQPVDVTLYWNAASSVYKYKYCYYSDEISTNACNPDDKGTWIDANPFTATQAKLSGLAAGKTYYWQVGAKLGNGDFVYAGGGWWSFKTKSMTSVTISGSAGVAGAILSYTDSTAKTATADGSGNYSFTVPYNWCGTVTPSKTGYTFTPVNRTYTNVQTNQTSQNFSATAPLSISGNAGVAGATLSYIDVTSKTATADGSGNYSFTVSYNWSGIVTPSKAGYLFTPVDRTYINVQSNQTSQNFLAVAGAIISGNVKLAGVTLSYMDGSTLKTATADSYGNYSITVPFNWSGTVTPSKASYIFTPVNKSYTNVIANQTAQNYTIDNLHQIHLPLVIR